MRFMTAVVVALTVAMSGCAAKELSNFKAEGVKKAAFDLGCDESAVKYKEVNADEVTVDGCGKEATYRQKDGAWGTSHIKSK